MSSQGQVWAFAYLLSFSTYLLTSHGTFQKIWWHSRVPHPPGWESLDYMVGTMICSTFVRYCNFLSLPTEQLLPSVWHQQSHTNNSGTETLTARPQAKPLFLQIGCRSWHLETAWEAGGNGCTLGLREEAENRLWELSSTPVRMQPQALAPHLLPALHCSPEPLCLPPTHSGAPASPYTACK